MNVRPPRRRRHLNHIAVTQPQRLIIVLNDNGRSYAPTVGGLAALAGLAHYRFDPRYGKTKRTLGRMLRGLPLVGETADELAGRLKDAVKQILTDEQTSSVRLVVNPEKMVISEARRTYTYLGLFGYRVDAVVVNRIIPDEVNDPYFGKWKDIQAEHLATVRSCYESLILGESRTRKS